MNGCVRSILVRLWCQDNSIIAGIRYLLLLLDEDDEEVDRSSSPSLSSLKR